MNSIKVGWILIFLSVGVLMPSGSSGQEGGEASKIPAVQLQPEEASPSAPQTSGNDIAIASEPPLPVQIQKPAPPPPAAKNPLSGEITEHRSPDGSIITVSRFNGQIPEHLLQPHLAGMFHPWNWNNQYLMGPFGWPYGPPRVQEGPFSSPSQVQTKPGSNKKKRSVDYASTPLGPTQSRTSNSFHYPAPPKEYWSKHKRPEVPLVDVDNTKLDHIYEKSKPKQ